MYPFDIAKRAMFIILNASLWNSQAGLSANAIRVVVKANIDLLIDAPIMTLVGVHIDFYCFPECILTVLFRFRQ